ncbi:hypothetical protein [Nocardia sp. NBC_01009]|uniref:hypothetical protein n=1 Tax=Nocardia sp. NBC_01009 TaxID=2975996 RepID=UPI00386EDC80|nr:hypothetical protein OHA42_24130 [Nocardia sp. NBC_01009]
MNSLTLTPRELRVPPTRLAADVTAGTDLTTSSTLSDLADLVRHGGDAAQFYTSGVHVTSYDAGVGELLDWFTSQIVHN